MRRTAYAAILAAVFLILLACAARGASPITLLPRFETTAATPATRPVLGVGPSEPYKTIPDAVAHAFPGDTIALDDGVHTFPSEVQLKLKGLTLRALNPPVIDDLGRVVSCRATIRYAGRTTASAEQQSALRVTADGVRIENICFSISGAKAISLDRCSDTVLHNLLMDRANTLATWQVPDPKTGKPAGPVLSAICGGFWGIQAQGTNRLTLDTVTFGLHAKYEMLFDLLPGGPPNRDMRLSRVTTTNSVFEHPCRLLSVQGITFDHCNLLSPFAGPGIKHVGGISVRGGSKNITIANSVVERGGYGAQNADEVTVQNVRLDNCTILNGYAVYRIAGLWINGRQIVAPFPTTAPATQPSTRPADVAKSLASEIKAIPGLPAAAAAKVDQLAGMVK